jgi:hypothetical protein
MSGLAKSESPNPQARNIARAPARLAPSIKIWLRGFKVDSVTIAVSWAQAFKGTHQKRKPSSVTG